MGRRKTNFDCVVPGCGKQAYSRGLCRMHESRKRRNGDPTALKTASTGEPEKFLRDAAARAAEDCIPWPFAKNPKSGYGVFQVKKTTTTAHRKQCELAHGAAPSPEHQAAHSCGNRMCVNPKHIRWATKVENAADRWLHGTQVHGERQWYSKLTRDQVKEIRRRVAMGQAAPDLANEFSVSPSHISRLASRESWAWLD